MNMTRKRENEYYGIFIGNLVNYIFQTHSAARKITKTSLVEANMLAKYLINYSIIKVQCC